MAYSTQPSIRQSNELFKEDLMTLATGIVWKNRTAAINAETTDTQELYRIELFVVANRGMLNWEVIWAFPRVVILNSGLDASLLEMYASDKSTVPESWRQTLVDEYAKALTSKNPLTGRYSYYSKATGEWVTVYEETNNYYRMLMGLPNYEASSDDYVYNTDPRWPTNIPVHEMELLDRIEMEKAGVLDELIKANPDKDYLKYVGKKCVDFFKARIADRYEILWRDDSQTKTLNHDFDDVYEKCRQLFMTVYYNEELRRTNNLYDSFMAMAILFMTLQQMQSYYLHSDITRDFYDIESLKVLYDAYSIPFYPEIPFEYHRKIVKNINRLISFKGSSQVFFDLFQIFDLGAMNIYHYYLTKRHKVDENNQPLYRFYYDEDGNVKLDEKNRPIYDPSVYEMKFSKVLIGEDPALAIGDRSNDVDYNLLTIPDPYWIEDNDLVRKLQSAKFNYLETKYIGIQTIFDLMSITFENAYVFRMITDNKEICEALSFRWTDLGIDCSLFDLFIYLAAIYCRLYGYEGMITNKIPAVMDTLGYNFEECREILRDKVLSDPILSKRQDLIDLMLDMDMETVDQANKVYNNIQSIREILMDGYQKAKTKEEFFAYRDLYNTLLVSKEVTSVYTNPRTGEIFETFTDVLAHCSPDLMQRYLLTDDDHVLEELSICIDKLEEVLSSMRWLPFSAGANSSKMIDSLFRILKFFKSAKAELLGYDITYAITLRGTNFFKNLGLIDRIYNNYWDNDQTTFMDFVETAHTLTKARADAFKMLDMVVSDHETVFWWDYIKYLTDCVWVIHDVIEDIFKHETWYIDFVQAVASTTMLKSKQLMEDCTMAEEITWDILEPKYFGLIKDEIRYLLDKLKVDGQCSYLLSLLYDIDFVHHIYTTFYLQKDARFRTAIKYGDKVMATDLYYHLDPDKMLFRETYEITRQLYTGADIQNLEDTFMEHRFMESFDTIELKDRLARIIALWKINDRLVSLTDMLKLVILVSKHHDLNPLTESILEKVKVSNQDDTWYIDVIDQLKNFATLVDTHLFDDQAMAETIMYEIFWPHFDERLDDDIQRYVDALKNVDFEHNCKIQVMDLLYLIDDVAINKVTVDLTKAGIIGFSINTDALKLKETLSKPDSKMLFSEFLAIFESTKGDIDETPFTDNLISTVTGNIEDEQVLTEALKRLMAYYLIDENHDMNDFMKLILSIQTASDTAKLMDELNTKLQQYSSEDSAALIDIMNDVIYRNGELVDVHGFEDVMERETTIFDDIIPSTVDIVKDAIYSLSDELRVLSDPDRNRAQIVDTMVLVNGLSRILAVHTVVDGFTAFASIKFSDTFKVNPEHVDIQSASDVTTFKDIIRYLDSKYMESKSVIDDFDDIWQKSEQYGFSVNEARDHLINIMAIIMGQSKYTLSDALRAILALVMIKDRQEAVDKLHLAVMRTWNDKDYLEEVDYVKAIHSIAFVNGLGDDRSKTEQRFFDALQITASEVDNIRDCAYELSDDIDHIDQSAMLVREMLALSDSLTYDDFDIPLVDVTETKDKLTQAKAKTMLDDVRSMSDVIAIIRETDLLKTEALQVDRICEDYQFTMADAHSITDLLVAIAAVARSDNDTQYLKDMIALVYGAIKSTDYNEAIDSFMHNIYTNISNVMISTDLLENQAIRSKIDDIAAFDDMVKAETVFFEVFEQEYSETIKDEIKSLTDRLMYSYYNGLIKQFTTIHLMDALYSGRVVINTKSSVFTSILDSTDDFFESGGVTKISSKTFAQDYFDRLEVTIGENDMLSFKDGLNMIDEYVNSDIAIFVAELYKVAAASKYVDEELFKSLLSFCKMCSMVSDNSRFMDYLAQTLKSYIYDHADPNDVLRFVKDVTRIIDTQTATDFVTAESVIFDDYEPLEIEFIEDIINKLTDKFATLSKHHVTAMIAHSTLKVIDMLMEKSVVFKLPPSIVEYTDEMIDNGTEARARSIIRIHEIFAEIGKHFSVFDKDIFTDMLLPTYLTHPSDKWESSDKLISLISAMISDETQNKEELITRVISSGEDEMSPIDKLLASEEAYGHEDLIKIIDQIRRIINIRSMVDEQIIMDILYGKYLDKYSDSKVLEDRINEVYAHYGIQREVDTLKDMLSKVEGVTNIETLQHYLDVLSMTFQSQKFDYQALLDEIYGSSTGNVSDVMQNHEVIKAILEFALNDSTEMRDALKSAFESIYADATKTTDSIAQSSEGRITEKVNISDDIIKTILSIAARDVIGTSDSLKDTYQGNLADINEVLEDLIKTSESYSGKDTSTATDIIKMVLQAAMKDVSVLKDILEVTYTSKYNDTTSAVDEMYQASTEDSDKDLHLADDTLLKMLLSAIVKDSTGVKDNIVETLVSISAKDNDVLRDFLMMAFNSSHSDTMNTEDSLSQTTESKVSDDYNLTDEVIKLILTAGDNDAARLNDSLIGAFKSEGFDIIHVNEMIEQSIKSGIVDESILNDGAIRFLLKTLMKDSTKINDMLRGKLSGYIEDPMELLECIKRSTSSVNTKDTHHVFDACYRSISSGQITNVTLTDDVLEGAIIFSIVRDKTVFKEILNAIFRAEYSDVTTTSDKISQTTESQIVDKTNAADEIIKVVLGAIAKDITILQDALYVASTTTHHDISIMSETITHTSKHFMVDEGVNGDKLICSIIDTVMKDREMFNDGIVAILSAKMLDEATLTDTVKNFIESHYVSDTSEMADAMAQSTQIGSTSDTILTDDLLFKIILGAFSSDSAILNDLIKMTIRAQYSDMATVVDIMTQGTELKFDDNFDVTDGIVNTIAQAIIKNTAIVSDAIVGAFESIHADKAGAVDSITGSSTGVMIDTNVDKDTLLKTILSISVKDSTVLRDVLKTALTASLKDITYVVDVIHEATQASSLRDSTKSSDEISQTTTSHGDDFSLSEDDLVRVILSAIEKDSSVLEDMIKATMVSKDSDTAVNSDEIKQSSESQLKDQADVAEGIVKIILGAIEKDSSILTDILTGTTESQYNDVLSTLEAIHLAVKTYVADDSVLAGEIVKTIIISTVKDSTVLKDALETTIRAKYSDYMKSSDVVSQSAMSSSAKDTISTTEKILQEFETLMRDDQICEEALVRVIFTVMEKDPSIMYESIKAGITKLNFVEMSKFFDALKTSNESQISDNPDIADEISKIIVGAIGKDISILKDVLGEMTTSKFDETSEFYDWVYYVTTAMDSDNGANIGKIILSIINLTIKDSTSFNDALQTMIESKYSDLMEMSDKISQKSLSSSAQDIASASDMVGVVFDELALADINLSDDEVIRLILGANLRDLNTLMDAIKVSYESIYADKTGMTDGISQTSAGHLVDTVNISDILKMVLSAMITDSAALTDTIKSTLASKVKDIATASDTLKQGKVVYSTEDESINDDDIIKGILSAAAQDIIRSKDILSGTMSAKHSDISDIIDAITKFADSQSVKDRTAAIDLIITTMLSSAEDAAVLKDLLKSTFESIYGDKSELSDTIQSTGSEAAADTGINDDDLIKLVLNSTTSDLVALKDVLSTSIFAKETDTTSTSDKLRSQSITGSDLDFNLQSDEVKLAQNLSEKDKSLLSDYIHGVIIGKPEEFLQFIESFLQVDRNKLDRDMLQCVSALVSESGTSKVSELHSYLDTISTAYADKYGEMWIVNDALTKGHIDRYVTDLFNAGDILKEQQKRAFITEVHKFIDTLVVAYYATMRDIMTIQDVIAAYDDVSFDDIGYSVDRLIAVIVGKITDKQVFLDTIITNFIGSLVDSQILKEQIRLNIELAKLAGDSLNYYEVFMNNEDKLRAIDYGEVDDSLIFKAERDFISNISTYLDGLKGIYTAYGFDYRQLRDAVQIANAQSSVASTTEQTDKVKSEDVHSKYSNTHEITDVIKTEGSSHSEDDIYLSEAIKKLIENLWVSLDQIPSKDNLLQKRVRYLMSELGYNTDILTSYSASYGVDNSTAEDSVNSSSSTTATPSDSGELTDTLSGEHHGKPEDDSTMNSVLIYTENLNTIIAPDRQSFFEALMSALLRFSIEDRFEYFADKLDLKKVTVKPEDITDVLDDLNQKGSIQSMTDYQKFSELLGRISEMCHIAKATTLQSILDEMCNQRIQFRIQDSVEKYKDTLKVDSELPAVVQDELVMFEKLYNEAIHVIAKNLSLMSDMSVEDAFKILAASPSHIEDTSSQNDKVSESDIGSQDKDDQHLTDTIKTTQGGFESDTEELTEQIHAINQKLTLLTLVGRFTEVLTLQGQEYRAEDVATTFTSLSSIESTLVDPIEDGQMLADILLGQNQIILCHPLNMKDGLYEFTPTGLRRVR